MNYETAFIVLADVVLAPTIALSVRRAVFVAAIRRGRRTTASARGRAGVFVWDVANRLGGAVQVPTADLPCLLPHFVQNPYCSAHDLFSKKGA